MEKQESNFTTVSIPKPLADKAKKFIESTGFTSLSSFVEFLLRDIVAQQGTGKGKTSEIKSVEEKLRRLGYL
jgi:Arc/MetJ-type ribon-helix-helix transcriptional regulator